MVKALMLSSEMLVSIHIMSKAPLLWLQVTSEPMQQAQQLWEALKPQAIKPIFESADVQPAAARETKRRRL